MGLAFDVGFGGLALVVERVEVLLQTRVGGDARIDGAAKGDPFNVPTRKDIDVLSKRVHELTVMTKKLSEEEETHGRGRAHRAKAE